jgi:hypothetical protein
MLLKEIWDYAVANFETIAQFQTSIHAVSQAIQSEFEKQVYSYKANLEQSSLDNLLVKPFPGKGEQQEAELLKLLGKESVSFSKTFVDTLENMINGMIRKEMLERKPDTLKITFED